MIMPMPDLCQHKFVRDGVRYRIGDADEHKVMNIEDNRPVFYYTSYFCEKCLLKHYEKMDLVLDIYAKIRYGALPLPEGEIPG